MPTLKENLGNLIKSLWKRVFPKKQDFCRFVISAFIAVVFVLIYNSLGNRFVQIMWIINLVLWSFILLVIAAYAGITVFRALVAASVALSLIIFLAQTYCDLPSHSASGVESLRGLMTIGLLYTSAKFVICFFKILQDYNKKLEKIPPSKIGILIIAIFLFFAFVFIQQVYLVVSPIFSNLYACELKK